MLDDPKWQMRSTFVYVVCLSVKVKVSHLKVRGRLSSGQKRLGSLLGFIGVILEL